MRHAFDLKVRKFCGAEDRLEDNETSTYSKPLCLDRPEQRPHFSVLLNHRAAGCIRCSGAPAHRCTCPAPKAAGGGGRCRTAGKGSGAEACRAFSISCAHPGVVKQQAVRKASSNTYKVSSAEDTADGCGEWIGFCAACFEILCAALEFNAVDGVQHKHQYAGSSEDLLVCTAVVCATAEEDAGRRTWHRESPVTN